MFGVRRRIEIPKGKQGKKVTQNQTATGWWMMERDQARRQVKQHIHRLKEQAKEQARRHDEQIRLKEEMKMSLIKIQAK
ncbi:hypothetical protein EVAR_31613_1 [Eumeta japonica]|uniref:Uncharacterized protein n=1 Tax=Eumeta variegata TaxID=151549 RepID=A0A4C1W0Z3_EUMVA|nr:hypothetical protein EVAR_31613_1 [Eumeta japonica]